MSQDDRASIPLSSLPLQRQSNDSLSSWRCFGLEQAESANQGLLNMVEAWSAVGTVNDTYAESYMCKQSPGVDGVVREAWGFVV